MGIVSGLWLIVLGVLAVPGLVIAKRPDAKQIIDKLAPYQGWIGVVSFLWGIFGLIRWFGMFGLLGAGAGGVLHFVIYTAYVVCMLALGFMLGIGVMKTFIKDAGAQARMDDTLTRIAPKQGILGLIAIVDGALLLVVTLFPSLL